MEQILLVEDEPTNRAILAKYLRKIGFKVDTAEDGAIAWDMLQENCNYVLIVTDRNMPNMDGIELFQKIKKSRHLNMPVIMQTAADSPQEVVEGIQAGVYYYLTKPYEEATLLTLVRAAIREHKHQQWIEDQLIKRSDALGKFVQGEFHIRNLEEAQNVSYLLGSLFPNPENAVAGLYELMVNAIEHGNLEIGLEEKGKLLALSNWEKEIRTRLQYERNNLKKVKVEFAQRLGNIEVTISDEGQGFDWRSYMDIEPSRATLSNGRGIAKANLLCFDKLSYNSIGNQVQALQKLKAK